MYKKIIKRNSHDRNQFFSVTNPLNPMAPYGSNKEAVKSKCEE